MRYGFGVTGRSTLSPAQVGARQFGWTRLGRRGWEPHQVRGFLIRVAEELAALRAELSRVYEENARIKRALRQWQSEQAHRLNQRS